MTDTSLQITKNKRENKNELELIIEAHQDFANKAYSIACRDISLNLDVPGFRKGKAPRNVVESTVGVGYISQKAFESSFFSLLAKAAIQEKLEIIDVVEISSFELLPEKPLNFKIIVELKPEVKIGTYKGLKIKAKKIRYEKDEFIKNTLDKLVQNFISYKPSERKIVQEGDHIAIDFEGKFEDGTDVPGGKAEHYHAVLEKGRFLPEFIEKLKGINLNEEKTIDITFPADVDKNLSGKKAIFKVKITEIEEKVYPEVNDELAKKLGLQTLDDLKQRIEKEMHEIQENNSKNDYENKLVDEIIKNSSFDLSENMREKEVDFLLNDLRERVKTQGIDWVDFKSDENNREIIDKARDAAIKRLSIDLVLGEVVKQEKITTTPEEIKKELEARISQMGENYKHLENDLKFKNSIEQSLLRNKGVDFLIQNNEAVWEEELCTLPPNQ